VRGVGSRIGTIARESSTRGGWLRSIPKGMICLLAMETFGRWRAPMQKGRKALME
jgi:hypothetical protein